MSTTHAQSTVAQPVSASAESCAAPLVSVIIPNYNYARFLTERIDSVLSQTFQNFELIILDDCSTDNSREVIERYRSNPKVSHIIYNQSNTGSPFAQWEKGLSVARGKYIWVAEADDSALPEFLAYAVAALEADNRVALVKTMSELVDADGNTFARPYFENYSPDGQTRIYDGDSYLEHRMIQRNKFYNASMVLFRHDAWASLSSKPYLKMRYTGDWLFWGMLMAGQRVAEVAKRLSRFRFHGHSVTDEGRVCQRAAFESKATVALLSLKLKAPDKHNQLYLRYQSDLLFRRKGYRKMARDLFGDDESIKRQFSIPTVTYPAYWLYKHLLWNYHKKLQATRCPLQPLSIL